MGGALEIAAGVRLPEKAITVRAVRSSGPGGQNVNKVSSKVELRVDLGLVEGLSEGARARLFALARNRLDGEGSLLVTSQRTRDQHRNLEDARGKVRDLVQRALRPPKVRRPTRVSASAKNARVDAKKRRAVHKKRRGPVRSDET